MSEVKKTALVDEHIRLGGRMVEFAGWYMPVQFKGLTDEHKCVRSNVGLFDVDLFAYQFLTQRLYAFTSSRAEIFKNLGTFFIRLASLIRLYNLDGQRLGVVYSFFSHFLFPFSCE